MTTLRDLEYQIQANTDGLNKAFPALDKLVKSLTQLETTVDKLAKSYDTNMQSMAKSSQTASNTATRSASQAQQQMMKQSDALKTMKQRVTDLNASLRSAGLTQYMGGNTRALQSFEKAMKSTNNTSYEFTRARNKMNETLRRSSEALRTAEQAQRQATATVQRSLSAIARQEGALERARIRYLDFRSALEKGKAAPAAITAAEQAFQNLETTLRGGAMAPQDMQRALTGFNAELANVKRGLGQTNPQLEKMGLNVNDVTKALQVALGPLSGVASRFTAFAAITKTNVLSVGLLIGAVIALVTVFGAAIKAASEFQSEMSTINKLLVASGHRAGIMSEEVDRVTSNIEMMTSATDNMAREASLAFLSLENFGGDLLEQSLLAAQGLSKVGRGDMISQARRLAKILEDPAGNLKALTEAGVYFNAVEAEKIKLLQESGRMHEAQQAVLAKLKPLQDAATSSGDTLASAWHQLMGELDNFLAGTLTETGALDSLTEIIKATTIALTTLGKELGLVKLIGLAFRGVLEAIEFVAKGVAGTLQLLAAGVRKFGDAVDYVSSSTEFLRKHIATQLGSLMVDIRRNVEQNVPKYIALPGIDPAEAAKLETDANLLVENIKKQWKMIEEGVRTGEMPAVDSLALLDMQNALAKFNMDPTIENFKEYQAAVAKASTIMDEMIAKQTGVESSAARMTREQAEATRKIEALMSTFTELRDEFARFVIDEKLVSARLKNMTENAELLREAFIKAGDPESAKMVGFLIRELEKGGTPLRKFVTGLEEQGKQAKLQIQINSSLGKSLDDLKLQQEIYNNVMAAGISVSSDFLTNMEELPEEIRLQVEAIIALTTALHALNKEAEAASKMQQLGFDLETAREGLRLARASDAERQTAMADLAARQEMLARGVEVGSEEWNKILQITKEISGLDLAAQQEDLLKGLEDQHAVAAKNLSLARGTTYARNEETAALQDQLDMLQRIGRIDEKELALRKQIRALELSAERQDAIKQMDMVITAMEREVQLGMATAAFRTEEVARLRDIIELTDKYGAATEEELQKRAKIRELQKLIDHNAEIQALTQEMQLQDTIAETMFMSETTQRSIVALRQKELELIQKYGSMQDPMAQREMAYFKALQERINWIERNLEPIADAFDSMFQSMEDGLVEFLSTGKLDVIAWGQSLAEDVFRTMWKSLVTDPLKDALGSMLGNFLKGGMPGIPNMPIPGVGQLGSSVLNPMYVSIVGGGVPGIPGAPTVGATAAAAMVTPGSTLSPQALAATVPMITPGATASPAQLAGMGAAGGTNLAASAVDKASSLLGLNEVANTGQINSFLQAGGVNLNAAQDAWCAAFVKSSLAQVGIETPGATNVATSFLNVGQSVDPANVMKGDILVQARGLAAGATGGHVGFATGATRMTDAGMQLQMLGGNQGNAVSTQWINAAELNVQRLTESTNALTTQMGGAATAATSMTQGATQAAQAATQFGAGAVPAATQAMQTMTTTGVVQATTGMTTTGTAALTTAASLNTLSASAQSAIGGRIAQGIGGLYHGGGVAGVGGALTSMWTGGFSGPRLAKGLMPNEFRAVLHRNEAVFNEDQLHALGNGLRARNEVDDDGRGHEGGANHFHFHGVSDASSFNKSRQQLSAWAAQQQRRADYYQN